MGKLFKVLGILLAVVAVLLIAAVVILPMVVDPNDYKGEIVAKVQEQTGRELRIDGDLKLSVFPWLGIEIGGMELSNAKGFGDKPFAAVEHAAVRVKLMPLLSSELEVDTIGLSGLELNLAKNERGTSNWDDLAKGDGGTAESSGEGTGEGGLAAFTIGGVDISNARVSWDDRSSGQQLVIDQFFLKSGAIRQGEPVGLEMGMLLESGAPAVKAKVDLKGTLALDEQAKQLSVDDLQVNLDAKGEALAGGALKATLETGLNMALDGSRLALSGLKVTAGDLQLDGDLDAKGLNATPAVNGKLNLAEFNLRQWLSAQELALPETADAAVLSRVGAAFSLASQGGSTSVNDIKMTLDDTQITGTASLKGEAIGFKLNLDQIDLDRYLPPPREPGQQESTGTSPTASEGTTAEAELLPVETLRGLNLNGTLSIGKLIINKLTAEKLEVTVKARNGKLNIDQKVGSFYQGSYQGKVSLDVTGKTPVMRIEKSLKDLQAGPLLDDLTEGEGRLTGKGVFNSRLNARGNTISAIKRSLGGTLDFRFENGAVKGVNLAQTLREAKAKFKGQSVPPSDQPVQTDFSELSGSAVIKKGVLNNQDLLAKSPYLRVTGAGLVNLVPETLDYTVKAVVVNTDKGQGGEGLEDLKGIPVPVRLTGPYAGPDYQVDWGKVLTGTQKAKVEKKKEEVKQKLETKLKDKLKGLF